MGDDQPAPQPEVLNQANDELMSISVEEDSEAELAEPIEEDLVDSVIQEELAKDDPIEALR